MALAQAIHDGTAIGISDGSFKDNYGIMAAFILQLYALYTTLLLEALL